MTNKPYEIQIAPSAARSISDLTSKEQKQVLMVIEALAINPRPPGSEKVDGMVGLYQEPIDEKLLIYKIEEHEVLVLLLK